jgi:allophanate hydrolase
MGRTGTTAIGLSQGGAMDKLALIEATALLGKTHPSPAIEFMGVGGSLRVLCDMTIALTGAEMHVKVGDRVLQWNATHTLNAGEIMELSAPKSGVYGYVTPHAELATPRVFDSRASHVSAGVGQWLQIGDVINGTSAPAVRSKKIRAVDRLGGGTVRYLAGPQTDLFSDADLDRFHATPFRASHIANRRGVKVDFEGAPFTPQNAHGIVSGYYRDGRHPNDGGWGTLCPDVRMPNNGRLSQNWHGDPCGPARPSPSQGRYAHSV